MLEGRLRAYAPAIILIAGCALLFQGTRTQESVPLAGPLHQVLAQVDGYRIEEQKVSDEERKVAGMSDYVARIYYRDTTLAFTTYVGYYDRQTQGHSMHSPKNCLPGAGWEILKTDVATIATAAGGSVVVNKYLLKNGPREAIVYYWYQGRGRVVASEYTVKWNLLHDAALLGHTEEALVRIVAYVPRPSTLPAGTTVAQSYADAEQLGAKVASQLLSDVGRVLPPSPKRSATSNEPVQAQRAVASNDR